MDITIVVGELVGIKPDSEKAPENHKFNDWDSGMMKHQEVKSDRSQMRCEPECMDLDSNRDKGGAN